MSTPITVTGVSIPEGVIPDISRLLSRSLEDSFGRLPHPKVPGAFGITLPAPLTDERYISDADLKLGTGRPEVGNLVLVEDWGSSEPRKRFPDDLRNKHTLGIFLGETEGGNQVSRQALILVTHVSEAGYVGDENPQIMRRHKPPEVMLTKFDPRIWPATLSIQD